MVRPNGFGYNEQTASDNAFQQVVEDLLPADIQWKAMKEFDLFTQILRELGIQVSVIEESENAYTPDAVFPNNWISFHADGAIITYPMLAPVRRKERRPEIWEKFLKQDSHRYWIDLSEWETRGKFLEGTGSMVLDRVNGVAYACLSERTHEEVLGHICKQRGWKGIAFHAQDNHGKDIYHTNVMMAIGTHVAIICLEAIANPAERSRVKASLEEGGHEVVPISFDQLNQFAGNMLEVHDGQGNAYLIMSRRAYESLSQSQRAILSLHAKIVSIPLDIIELCGGGSVRCMMAEIF